jgi:hypothetical protein
MRYAGQGPDILTIWHYWSVISWDLSAEDLWTIWFPHFADMDTLTIIPAITFRLEAWCQGWIKILRIFIPIHCRIFLGAPIRDHGLRILPYPLMAYCKGGVKLLFRSA